MCLSAVFSQADPPGRSLLSSDSVTTTSTETAETPGGNSNLNCGNNTLYTCTHLIQRISKSSLELIYYSWRATGAVPVRLDMVASRETLFIKDKKNLLCSNKTVRCAYFLEAQRSYYFLFSASRTNQKPKGRSGFISAALELELCRKNIKHFIYSGHQTPSIIQLTHRFLTLTEECKQEQRPLSRVFLSLSPPALKSPGQRIVLCSVAPGEDVKVTHTRPQVVLLKHKLSTRVHVGSQPPAS